MHKSAIRTPCVCFMVIACAAEPAHANANAIQYNAGSMKRLAETSISNPCCQIDGSALPPCDLGRVNIATGSAVLFSREFPNQENTPDCASEILIHNFTSPKPLMGQ